VRVLLTGASGFIGRFALEELAARGVDVITACRTAPRSISGARHETVDLLEPGSAEAVVRRVRPTHLLHLAWNATPGHFWSARDNLDWSAATLLLMRAFADVGGQRAVFAGTCAEYAWGGPLLSEGDPLEPTTFYGQVKDATRRAVCAAGDALGVSVAWGRIFWIYGPHEAPRRLIHDVAASLVAGEPALCSDGFQRRDFLHVRDVAGAFIAALGCDWRGPFNVGSGEAPQVRELVMALAHELGRPDLVRLGARPSPVNEPAELRADIAVLRDEIGFAPTYSLAGGLAEVATWWRDEKHSP
jgi:UDP-glucose 4-epimerase